MSQMLKSMIVATGSCIPEVRVQNTDFANTLFYGKDGSAIGKDNYAVIDKFKDITGITERRYALPAQTASDLGYLAAKDALDSSGIDREQLDYIIVAHNFGDVQHDTNRIDTVPTLASRIKCLLQVKNPDCIAYDLPFGCPGWVEGMIQANYYIRSGDARHCLVIGAETLSRVIDPHDRDSMLYGDGAGAVILAAANGDAGILAHKTQTHAWEHAMLLRMDSSYATGIAGCQDRFLKMNGRKLYEFALSQVPLVIQAALDKAGIPLTGISKVLIHQANEKMDDAILQRLFKLNGITDIPPGLMPMTISWLGNSSVATVPTLLDLIAKGKLENQYLNPGDQVIFASVGAGMNINAVIYRF